MTGHARCNLPGEVGGIPPAILFPIEILLKINGIREVLQKCARLYLTQSSILPKTLKVPRGEEAGLQTPEPNVNLCIAT